MNRTHPGIPCVRIVFCISAILQNTETTRAFPFHLLIIFSGTLMPPNMNIELDIAGCVSQMTWLYVDYVMRYHYRFVHYAHCQAWSCCTYFMSGIMLLQINNFLMKLWWLFCMTRYLYLPSVNWERYSDFMLGPPHLAPPVQLPIGVAGHNLKFQIMSNDQF